MTSEEAAKTSETLAYLEICHFLFERGFLSHERIRSLNSDVIKNINKGYHYFSGWLTDLIEYGMTFNYNQEFITLATIYACAYSYINRPTIPTSSNTQKEFLSWQSKYFDCIYIYIYIHTVYLFLFT